MGFSRQEYWSGLPFPSLGDLPDPGIEPGSPALKADALTSEQHNCVPNSISNNLAVQVCPLQYLDRDHTKTNLIVYLALRFNQASCILFGKPVWCIGA